VISSDHRDSAQKTNANIGSAGPRRTSSVRLAAKPIERHESPRNGQSPPHSAAPAPIAAAKRVLRKGSKDERKRVFRRIAGTLR